MVEVLRIEGGCAIVDYVALGGRRVSEVRAEILASDPAAHAVGLPPRDLQPDVWQTPPSPYDGDGYGAGDWWHLDRLGALVLWDPAGWEYTDDSGNQRRVAGWSEDVIVAVLDSGTFAHRDLEGSLVDAVGGSWLDMECHRDDRSGHGTHVAGLIAAQRGNGRDVAGLAPEARILPIHLLSAGTCPVDGSDLTDAEREAGANSARQVGLVTATQAVRLAAEAGAKVINMSFRWHDTRSGSEGDRRELDNAGFDVFEAMLLAVMERYGVVAVTSAGNCGDPSAFDAQDEHWRGPGTCPRGLDTLTYPKAYPHVIAVAATDRADGQAVFSTSNVAVDIAAPGDSSYDEDGDGEPDYTYSGIVSTVPLLSCDADDTDNDGVDDRWTPQGCGLSSAPIECPAGTPLHTDDFTTPGQCAHHVAHKSGTSMAAPLVSATAAHMKSRYPLATPSQIYSALTETARIPGKADIAFDYDYGFGIINPKKAIEHLDQHLTPSPQPEPTTQPTQPDPDPTQPSTIPNVGPADDPGTSTESFTSVEANLGGCGVRTDGTIACPTEWDFIHATQAQCWTAACDAAGQRGSLIASISSEDRFISVSASGEIDPEYGAPLTDICGLRADRTIHCWFSPSWGNWGPEGEFTTVSVLSNGLYACGVRTDGSVQCWPSPSSNLLFESYALDGDFEPIDGGNCGVLSDGTVRCWGIAGERGSYRWEAKYAPADRFTHVFSDIDLACGVKVDQSIKCWDTENGAETYSPDGRFTSVSVGNAFKPLEFGYRACGLVIDGAVKCWNDEGRALHAPDGPFASVDVSTYLTNGREYGIDSGLHEYFEQEYEQEFIEYDERACGIRADGSIECWSLDANGTDH